MGTALALLILAMAVLPVRSFRGGAAVRVAGPARARCALPKDSAFASASRSRRGPSLCMETAAAETAKRQTLKDEFLAAARAGPKNGVGASPEERAEIEGKLAALCECNPTPVGDVVYVATGSRHVRKRLMPMMPPKTRRPPCLT